MPKTPARCIWITFLSGALGANLAQASMQTELPTSEPLGVFLSLAEINAAISTTLSSIEHQLAEQSCNEHAEKAAVVRAQAEYDTARSLHFASPNRTNQNRMDQAQLALTVAQEHLGHTRQFIENLHQSLNTLNQQIAGNSEQIARLGLLVEREHVSGNRWLEDQENRPLRNRPDRKAPRFAQSSAISAVPNPH